MDAQAPLPLVPGLADGPLTLALALVAALVLGLARMAARRRGAPVAFRRALLSFLLMALVTVVVGLIPAGEAPRARPALRVLWQVLGWVGLFEAAQGLAFDLLLTRLLRRPPLPRILRDLLTLVFAGAVLALALRGTLGVNITSLLATSAMISVVLGLALQDTLGGFFSGLALQMEKPLEEGDWVRVGDQTGQVIQVSWRSVRLRSLDEDEVTVPNAVVARSVMTNFSRPTLVHRHTIDIRVHLRHPPNRVIRAMEEAMRGTPGVLDAPEAYALVWRFDEDALVYQARFFIDNYRDVFRVMSRVAARIWYRFHRDGIELPLPGRVVRQEGLCPEPFPGGLGPEEALRAVDLFAPLTGEEVTRLCALLRPLAFGSGETILRQGDPGGSLFVVTRGRVEVRVARDGVEGVVSTLGPGSVFGEMSLLTGQPRAATVVTVEDTQVLAVTRESFRAIVAENPAVLDAVTRVVASRRGQLEEAIRETEEAAAARAAGHEDLLERVRAFFGV